jgi:hypothetical protein
MSTNDSSPKGREPDASDQRYIISQWLATLGFDLPLLASAMPAITPHSKVLLTGMCPRSSEPNTADNDQEGLDHWAPGT